RHQRAVALGRAVPCLRHSAAAQFRPLRLSPRVPQRQPARAAAAGPDPAAAGPARLAALERSHRPPAAVEPPAAASGRAWAAPARGGRAGLPVRARAASGAVLAPALAL